MNHEMAESGSNVLEFKEAANEFGFELFKVFIARHKNEYLNLCFSPFAVYNSLLMVMIGAEGESQSQLAKVLHLSPIESKSESNKETLELWRVLREAIIKSNHDILWSVSYLYCDQSLTLKPEYKSWLKEYFFCKPRNVKFGRIKETVETINKDSYDGTDEVIDEVIADKDLTENKDVKLILTNSQAFRGFWALGFDINDTKESLFRFKKGEQFIETPILLMKSEGYYRHLFWPQLDAYVVFIGFNNSDLRMIVILPKDESSDGYYLINGLNRQQFSQITDTMNGRNKTLVEVCIPRFSLMGQKISLQRTIKQMGATDVFEALKADLSIMSDQRPHLTKLVHKTFLLVDERGELGFHIKKKKNEPNASVKFKADHPFVFIVSDKTSNVALLMGLFGDPTQMLEVVPQSQISPQKTNQLLTRSEDKKNE